MAWMHLCPILQTLTLALKLCLLHEVAESVVQFVKEPKIVFFTFDSYVLL